MLPWVHDERRQHRERGARTTAESYLACGPCMEAISEPLRQTWNCGRAPRLADHHGEYPVPGNAERPGCDTCPGYLISLPQVHETARAYSWWDKGQLRDHCDGQTPPANLRLYIDVLHEAVSEVQTERLKPKGAGRA